MAVESDHPGVPAATPALSQLQQQWNVRFVADALESLPTFLAQAEEQQEQDAASSATRVGSSKSPQCPLTLQQLQRLLLFTDLRALPLHPALPEGKLQSLSNNSHCSSCKVTLGVPLLLMLLSSRDITLPTKEGEEDFVAAAQSTGRRRLLLLKLTDGKCTYTAIERSYCTQLDKQPLIPGLKLLLLPSTPVLKNLLLLLPDSLRVLGGNVPALGNAFRLRVQIQQLRSAGSSSSSPVEELQEQKQQQVGAESTLNGPPKFQPFSQAAVRRAALEGQQVTQTALQQQQLQQQLQQQRGVERLEEREGKKIALRTFRGEAAASSRSNSSADAAAADSHASSAGGSSGARCSKLEKLQQLQQEKKAAAQLALGADSVGVTGGRYPHHSSSGRGRGGGASGRSGRRMRRNAGREDPEDYQYMKSSNAPVSYNLLDLLQKDQRPMPKGSSGASESAAAFQPGEKNSSSFAERIHTGDNDGTLERSSRSSAAVNQAQEWQGWQEGLPPLELRAQQQFEVMMMQQRAALEFYASRAGQNASAAAQASGFSYQHSRHSDAAAYCNTDVECAAFDFKYAQQQQEAGAEEREAGAASMFGEGTRGRGRRGRGGGFRSFGRGVRGRRAEQRGSKREY